MLNERIVVLDKGWIELQDVMGTDLDIVGAARTSFRGESKGEDNDRKLLKYLWINRHHSPFEMCEIKVRLHAPELVWRQALRHRTANANLQSGRYTEYLENEFYVPTVWRLQAVRNKQGSEGELNSTEGDELSKLLQAHYEAGYQLYQKALGQNVAREQARLFLGGFGAYSTGVMKFDLRNLLHFLELRNAPDAQWEIRQYAIVIDTFIKEYFPWTWEVVNDNSRTSV